MGILLALLAALMASVSNLFMRRSIDAGGSSRGYLVVQLTISFLLMIYLNPVRAHDYAWNTPTVLLGLIGGVFLGLLMWGLGKTLEKGPPGLSFAILNSSTVMPAILLTLLFGSIYNHTYTLTNGFGSLLVVAGLLWAGWTAQENPNKKIWALLALFIFVIHALFLVYLQWWAMILKPDLPLSSLLPFHLETTHIQWFMPTILLVGALFQWAIYFAHRSHIPKKAEITYGVLGGITNGVCTYFLILAPQAAAPWENAMIFPVFAVTIIVLSNTWAQILYKEKVNWLANLVCVVGVLIGVVAWNALL